MQQNTTQTKRKNLTTERTLSGEIELDGPRERTDTDRPNTMQQQIAQKKRKNLATERTLSKEIELDRPERLSNRSNGVSALQSFIRGWCRCNVLHISPFPHLPITPSPYLSIYPSTHLQQPKDGPRRLDRSSESASSKAPRKKQFCEVESGNSRGREIVTLNVQEMVARALDEHTKKVKKVKKIETARSGNMSESGDMGRSGNMGRDGPSDGERTDPFSLAAPERNREVYPE